MKYKNKNILGAVVLFCEVLDVWISCTGHTLQLLFSRPKGKKVAHIVNFFFEFKTVTLFTSINKLASFEAMLVRNYSPPSNSKPDVKCRL